VTETEDGNADSRIHLIDRTPPVPPVAPALALAAPPPPPPPMHVTIATVPTEGFVQVPDEVNVSTSTKVTPAFLIDVADVESKDAMASNPKLLFITAVPPTFIAIVVSFHY
jgi:hypothetical protein